jgi:hypothetical protein
VIDTNVPVTANGKNEAATPTCVIASARSLQAVMRDGHVFIDADGLITREYRANLHASGQPGPGDVFLKWLLTNEWSEQRVSRVRLTPQREGAAGFEELPAPQDGVVYDPSDCKFLAVAAAHAEHPPILQATDSKWWGWRQSLASAGVSIHFLCPEIERKYREKMGE